MPHRTRDALNILLWDIRGGRLGAADKVDRQRLVAMYNNITLSLVSI